MPTATSCWNAPGSRERRRTSGWSVSRCPPPGYLSCRMPNHAEDEFVETMGRGRRSYTPFAVIGVVGSLVAVVAGILILVTLLIWFLG